MKDSQSKSPLALTRVSVILVSLLMTLVMAVFAVAYSLIGNKATVPTKDEILTNVATVNEKGKNYSYAASYLLDYGIRGFDAAKFKRAESFFDNYSVYEQKPKEELAAKTAELFVEFYFDKTDLTDKEAVTDALIACFVEATGDRYAVYRTKVEYEDYKTDMSGSFVGIGVYIRYSSKDGTVQVTSVMDDSAALEAGILAGDYLYAVDGKTLAELGYENFVNSIRGEIGTAVTITVLRGTEYVELTAIRKQITEKSVKYSINDEKIGYVQLTSFKANTAVQFCEAIDALEDWGAVGIVFDLRDNPGGYLSSVVDVIDYLVPKDTRIASYTSVSGEIVYNSTSEHFITVPISVIFNENTASAGELFSAAMRDYAKMGVLSCTTVGVNTYSKGVMQNTGSFSDGSTLTLTIAYYNPPCDINYDGEGVQPDIEVKWSADGDPQLDAAYDALENLLNKQVN